MRGIYGHQRARFQAVGADPEISMTVESVTPVPPEAEPLPPEQDSLPTFPPFTPTHPPNSKIRSFGDLRRVAKERWQALPSKERSTIEIVGYSVAALGLGALVFKLVRS